MADNKERELYIRISGDLYRRLERLMQQRGVEAGEREAYRSRLVAEMLTYYSENPEEAAGLFREE